MIVKRCKNFVNCGYNVPHCTVRICIRYVVVENGVCMGCMGRMDENYKMLPYK